LDLSKQPIQYLYDPHNPDNRFAYAEHILEFVVVDQFLSDLKLLWTLYYVRKYFTVRTA
tara:strand:+ start:1158 stop:1334 length:177 start_codon:yes stop_codon:yes gene_type:complete